MACNKGQGRGITAFEEELFAFGENSEQWEH